MRQPCDMNCFECKFPDCINDLPPTPGETELQKARDPERPKKRRRSYENLSAQEKYLNTEKEKQAKKRYAQSAKGKQTQKRYSQSEKGRERMYKYNHSEKGIAARKRYEKKRRQAVMTDLKEAYRVAERLKNEC